MRKRYVYSILFGIPGLFASLVMAFLLFGAIAGAFWIFVFGDKPWPHPTEKTLSLLFVLSFLMLWVAVIVVGFTYGKKLEGDDRLNGKHLAISVGLTVGLLLCIVLHQLGVGNIGPKADDRLCSDFCRHNGYSASGMPPKNSGEHTCICYDGAGQEALQVPIETIVLDE